jgi:hypothetical protein
MSCSFGTNNPSDSSWLESLTPVEMPAATGPTSHSPALSSPPPPTASSPLGLASARPYSPLAAAPHPSSPRHASFRPASPLANGSAHNGPAHDGRVQELLQALQQRDQALHSLQAEKAALETAAREADKLKTGTVFLPYRMKKLSKRVSRHG